MSEAAAGARPPSGAGLPPLPARPPARPPAARLSLLPGSARRRPPFLPASPWRWRGAIAPGPAPRRLPAALGRPVRSSACGPRLGLAPSRCPRGKSGPGAREQQRRAGRRRPCSLCARPRPRSSALQRGGRGQRRAHPDLRPPAAGTACWAAHPGARLPPRPGPSQDPRGHSCPEPPPAGRPPPPPLSETASCAPGLAAGLAPPASSTSSSGVLRPRPGYNAWPAES